MTTSSNGFKVGTATNGRFENISFSNSVIHNGLVPLNERVIAGIALEIVDGGSMDGITISNIRMENVRTPLFIRLAHRHRSAGTHLRNVVIRGIHATGAILTSSITGMPYANVEAVTISDILLRTQEQGEPGWKEVPVPEVPSSYPEARMFGRLPAYGLYVRHANGIRLRNIEVISETADPRPVIVCDDVHDLTIAGLETTNQAIMNPVIVLRNTRRAYIHASRAPEKSKLFLEISGTASEAIVLGANDLTGSEQIVSFRDDARSEALKSGNTGTLKAN